MTVDVAGNIFKICKYKFSNNTPKKATPKRVEATLLLWTPDMWYIRSIIS